MRIRLLVFLLLAALAQSALPGRCSLPDTTGWWETTQRVDITFDGRADIIVRSWLGRSSPRVQEHIIAWASPGRPDHPLFHARLQRHEMRGWPTTTRTLLCTERWAEWTPSRAVQERQGDVVYYFRPVDRLGKIFVHSMQTRGAPTDPWAMLPRYRVYVRELGVIGIDFLPFNPLVGVGAGQ